MAYKDPCDPRARERRRRWAAEHREYQQNWQRQNAERHAQLTRESRERHPEKTAARTRVSVAVAAGKLIKQPCEVCGSEPAQAHHDDYTKPLDVRWLCTAHHAEHHMENAT